MVFLGVFFSNMRAVMNIVGNTWPVMTSKEEWSVSQCPYEIKTQDFPSGLAMNVPFFFGCGLKPPPFRLKMTGSGHGDVFTWGT